MSILLDTACIGEIEIKNRFVRSATFDGCGDKSGHVSDKQLHIFEKLANGGVGLIITGITYVHRVGKISSSQNSLASDDCISGFRKLSSLVHKKGAKVAVQLFHGGREVARVYSPEQRTALAPWLVENDPFFRKPHRSMAEEEIWETINAFGDAARRAREAGLDAVQLHGAHGYLLSQFLSPFTNRRSDKWGGTLENRLRFHKEIIRNIRKKAGKDYSVFMKIGVHDGFPGGLEFSEGKRAAQFLVNWGFDALEISSGLRGRGYENSEFKTGIKRVGQEAYFRKWCKEIKDLTKAPIIIVGGLRTFKLMEEIISEGGADFIAMSRPFINEPGLINSWRKSFSSRSDCISCNKCFEAVLSGDPLRCAHRDKRDLL